MKRGIVPGIMRSLATGAMSFGVIESTKKWIEKTHPNLNSHWVHFFSGPIGDILGSFVYAPCEVMKQCIQVQGFKKYWASVIAKEGSHAGHGMNVYGYYLGMFQAGCSKWKERGLKGLYAGMDEHRKECGGTSEGRVGDGKNCRQTPRSRFVFFLIGVMEKITDKLHSHDSSSSSSDFEDENS